MTKLEQAFAHQKAGRLPEAEAIYRQILAHEPGHAEALHWLGVIALQRGQSQTASTLIEQALQERPGYAEAQNNYGFALHMQGRLAEAIAAYERALELAPNDTEVYCNLGLVLQESGRLEDAIAAFQRSLAQEPTVAAHLNLGNAYAEQGQLDNAIVAYLQAAALDPTSAAAYHQLGVTLRKAGKVAEAIAASRKALEIAPSYPELHNNLGVALLGDGSVSQAVAAFRQALALKPDFAEAHYNLGNALQSTGNLDEAAVAYRHALARKPEFADALNNLGILLQHQGKLDEAIDVLRQLLRLHPSEAAHVNLGSALQEKGSLSEAADALVQALTLDPNSVQAHNNLGTVHLARGEHDAALTCFQEALDLEPTYAEAHSNLLQAMHYSPAIGPEALYAEARRWHERHAAPFMRAWRPRAQAPDPDRRLRLGYVSPDLRAHPVGVFFLPVFTHHDRGQFELYGYAGVRQPDAMTEAFKTHATHWREVAGLDDAALAERIRADGIDILVDLSGHSRGHRLLVFARKPAPVQVTAGGHYDTTGLAAIDYLIADRFHAPEGAERYFAETLVRLPHDYICYAPPAYAPGIAEPPCRQQGVITFGCYNNLAKVNEEVIALWARMLKALPGSRLRLQTRELNDPATRARYRDLFRAHGLAEERLELQGPVGHRQLLAAYGAIDIALDPFPYSGGLTTLEALWMGVPVVTLTGQSFCGRHSTAHLANVGLSEFVTTTPEAYVAVALALARDPERLRALRARLRDQMAASPLCDARGYTRALEAAYRGMWKRYCENRDTSSKTQDPS